MQPEKPLSYDDLKVKLNSMVEASLPLDQIAPAVSYDTTRLWNAR